MSSGRRSPPQDAGNYSPAIVEPFYTNEDVALLHDIVVLAQQLLPSLPEGERLPTNALFDAYYDILPRTGLNADHDNRYARVLFKIGGVRGDGTLYDKFEEVLSRMGIEIEFDEAEPDSDSQHERGQAALEDTEAAIMLQDENIAPRGRARRNSDSACDLGIESPAKQRQRCNSYSSHNEAKAPPMQDRHGFLRELVRQQPSKQPSREERDMPGSNVGAWLNAKPAPHRKDRGRSISTQAGIHIHRRSLSAAIVRPALTTTTASPNSDQYHVESETTAFTSAHEPELTESINFPPEQILSKPSTSLMQTKAEVILRHHLSFLAKRQLRIWRDQALQRRATNANLHLIAFQHDKNALLNQALDTWHSRYLEKRSIAETERFFAHLERRSARARDLYLLHKSFTHWHGSACEGAERTQAARRHILRTRFFNAWRDITAVKELKVRRQVLKKFFGVWQRKHIVIRSNDTTAMQRFGGNLVEEIFKQWVRKVWGIKASTWWAEGVKQRTFSLWKISAREALEADRSAEEERRLQLAWNAWRIWRAKASQHANQVQQAATFHQIYLCVGAIRKWRGETRVIPAKKTLQTEISTRILRNTFGIWLHRLRQERQAAVIDRMRILREAWTNWRHKSRLQMMRVRVDEQVIWTSVFKWMLARRVSTAKHESREKLLRKTLQHWAARAQESKFERWDGEGLARQFVVQKTEQHLMRHWLARSQIIQQLDADARDFHASRLLQEVLLKWSGKHPHLRQLQQWSRDAEFYFLISKTLKRWKVSTEISKREKRKAAYAQVRRTTKMNLGRDILHGWRSKARQILDMQAQAQQKYQNRNVIIVMSIFDRWRARAEELEDVESKCREKVLGKFFETWRGRSIAFQELKVEAIISFQERQESRAIRKWKLVVLQIRGRSIQAAEVQERNAKRTFRRMFSYWHQKAAGRRPVKHLEVTETGRPAQLGATARAETWSDFGDEEGEWAKGHEEPVASTPLPGYLSTPSRRMERAVAAAARFSSTTPKAPLSTPFERHLRAQYSGGMPSLRRPLGRSTLGLGGGFPDITDRTTNDGREDP